MTAISYTMADVVHEPNKPMVPAAPPHPPPARFTRCGGTSASR